MPRHARSIPWVGLALLLCLPASGPAASPAPRRPDIIVDGKLYCPVTRTVVFPFNCTVRKILVRNGDPVQDGAVLAECELHVGIPAMLQRRLRPSTLDDVELNLLETEHRHRNLTRDCESSRKLLQQNLATPEQVFRMEQDLALQERRLLVLQRRLALERKSTEDELQRLRLIMGVDFAPDAVPAAICLRTRITGRVVFMAPNVRVNACGFENESAFVIGTTDPMLMRAQVHEMDIPALALDKAATLTFESLPGKTFAAKVSRISWTPVIVDPSQPSYYEVEFTLPNPDGVLRDGFKGKVTIPNTRP